MDLFSFWFSWLELAVFAVLFFSFVYQLYFYIHYLSGVLRRNRKMKKGKTRFNTVQPPVSIIIAAKDEEDNLRRFLPKVLEQDYPAFEVIVINDASRDDTETICRQFKEKYPHLRTTFVPQETKNINSKKLALTLGVKAAQYDILLFTDADCYPEDKCWIARMVRNFEAETEFVLGYGAYLKKPGFLNRLITYDTLFIAMQYMGTAIAGKPYMGVGRNMAYRKETFFRLKGFSSNLDILSGDDDLIVNKGGNKNNTAVEISHESITWSEPKTRFRDWYYQKARHLSSSTRYKSSTKMLLAIEPFMRGLFYLSFLAAAVFGNLITLAVALLLFLLRLTVQMIVVNRTARLYDECRYYFSLPVLDVFLPLVNLFILIFGRKRKVIWK